MYILCCVVKKIRLKSNGHEEILVELRRTKVKNEIMNVFVPILLS